MCGSLGHKIATSVIFMAFTKYLKNATWVSAFLLPNTFYLPFVACPFPCSSLTLHLSGHGGIFPLLFLCCGFPSDTVTVLHVQTLVVLLLVLLATSLRINPSLPLFSYSWIVTFQFRGACPEAKQPH